MKKNRFNLNLTLLLCFILLAVSSMAQDTDLKNGLIGYYRFNGNASDESGNNNHGEINGVNKEKDVTGMSGESFRWNDEDDNIKLPIDINPVSLPQVSICAWVKLSNNREKVIVVSNDDRDGDRKIYTEINDKKHVWAISNGEGKFIGKTPTQRGKWTFLVATYNNKNNKASIYVDGEKTEGTAKVDMGADYILVGANPYGNDDFEALIDEVRVYDRILSKQEIDSLQNLIIPEPPKKKEQKEYFYLTELKISAKSKPTKDSKDIAIIEKGDTLRFKECVPSVGGKYNE